jgi:hypothetical protein
MLDSSRLRILRELESDDLVLDVGAGANPFERADWVIDLMPYESRGLYGSHDRDLERFTDETWVRRDICAICSHTLEDVRDPVWVCEELIRVARAGYLETPSRLEEQTFGVQGPWVGWGHHHWLVETGDDEIEFVYKHQILHGRPEMQISLGSWQAADPEERTVSLWWEGSFEARERIFTDSEPLDRYLTDFAAQYRQSRWRRLRARTAGRARSPA